jgi:glycosyltransferase involved in cell wall biosynthesis
MGIRSVAVDLTLMLSEGGSGDAEVFCMELLRALAAYRPGVQFALLTRPDNHEMFASLELQNVRRVLTTDRAVSNQTGNASPWMLRTARAVLPARALAVVGRWAYAIDTTTRRFGSRRLLRRLGPDLVFCPLASPTYMNPAIPTVAVLSDIRCVIYPEHFDRGDGAYRKQNVLDVCRRAGAVATGSQFVRRSTISFTGIAPDRIQTIPPRLGSRLSGVYSDDVDVTARFDVSPGRYLVYPSNLWPHQNHELLLVAVGMARTAGLPADVGLVCTGGLADRRTWLCRASTAMGLDNQVLFPGSVTDAELAALVKSSAGLIIPSLYEGFGLSSIEAMAIGVPVACSCLSALPETVGDAALLFDPRVPADVANALVRLVMDRTLRAHLLKVGYRRALEFSDATQTAAEYWDLFENAVSAQTTGQK